MAAANTKKTKKSSVSSVTLHRKKPKVRRPGVHAKTKCSKSKSSTNYKKRYRGQGR